LGKKLRKNWAEWALVTFTRLARWVVISLSYLLSRAPANPFRASDINIEL